MGDMPERKGYSVLELVTLIEAIYNAVPDVENSSSIDDVVGYIRNVLEFVRVAGNLPDTATIRDIELGLYELLIAANPEVHNDGVHSNIQ